MILNLNRTLIELIRAMSNGLDLTLKVLFRSLTPATFFPTLPKTFFGQFCQ
jgi:hypothetical protein